MNILDIEERRIKLPKAESYEVQDKKIRLEILKKKLSDPELLEFEKAQIRANIKELEHSIKAEGY
ncbi:MAG: hypothetical protein M0R17_01360 [Candidatus Omnitrophica bacterium]|jgi:uncharacterized protein (UPF0335 family)|nr:hypothetical protein [Candidatus Omnitrophota bacterium]